MNTLRKYLKYFLNCRKVSAITVTFAVVVLAMGTDTLALDLLAGVTTPLARVHLLSTDFTAVAGLLGPTADAAAATRVINLRSSTVWAASAGFVLV